MNNFYASVECMLNMSLRGHPVAVGGDVSHFITLLFHQHCAVVAKLNPGIGVNAIINAVVARLIASSHTAVGGIDDGTDLEPCNVSLPDVKVVFYGGKVVNVRYAGGSYLVF